MLKLHNRSKILDQLLEIHFTKNIEILEEEEEKFITIKIEVPTPD